MLTAFRTLPPTTYPTMPPAVGPWISPVFLQLLMLAAFINAPAMPPAYLLAGALTFMVFSQSDSALPVYLPTMPPAHSSLALSAFTAGSCFEVVVLHFITLPEAVPTMPPTLTPTLPEIMVGMAVSWPLYSQFCMVPVDHPAMPPRFCLSEVIFMVTLQSRIVPVLYGTIPPILKSTNVLSLMCINVPPRLQLAMVPLFSLPTRGFLAESTVQ